MPSDQNPLPIDTDPKVRTCCTALVWEGWGSAFSTLQQPAGRRTICRMSPSPVDEFCGLPYLLQVNSAAITTCSSSFHQAECFKLILALQCDQANDVLEKAFNSQVAASQLPKVLLHL